MTQENREQVEQPVAGETQSAPQESVETLKAQLAEATRQAEELKTAVAKHEESYKGLQTKYNKTYQEFQSTKDVMSRIDALQETQKILAAAIAEGRNTDMENPQTKEVLLSKFAEVEKQTIAKQQAAEAKRRQDEFTAQGNTIWDKVKDLPAKDPNKILVRAALNNGDLEAAQELIKDIEVSKVVEKTPEKKPEIDIEAEVTKRLNALIKERGLDKQETGQPSGTSTTSAQAYARYANGEISADEARKLGVKFT